jgi:Fe-S-cluster containining protein
MRCSAPVTEERVGPAARARAAGRGYDIKLLRSAMTPLAQADGALRTKGAAPYLPVLDACSLCPARCCHLNVKVSLPDAIRYTTILDLPFFAGMTVVPSDHATHAARVVRDVRLIPEDEGWLGAIELQLRRTSSGACHALVDIGGYLRCSAYAARPSICRLYPYTWTSDVARGSPGVIMCPVPYAITPAAEAQAHESITRSIEDWELHDDVVAEWHAEAIDDGARTIDAFLSFAIGRTAERMGVKAEIALAKGTPQERLYGAMLASGVVRKRS